MYDKISKKMVDYAINNNIISNEDEELYMYAYTVFLSYFISISTMFIIGIAFNSVLNTVIFLLFFYPVRVYAGGFHESSFKKCYVASSLMYVAVLLGERLLIFEELRLIICIILVLSIIIIFIEAPQESENKPLTEIEYKRYKFKARLFLVIETIILITLMVFNVSIIIQYYAIMGIITTGLLLFLGLKD